jgi:hypothetical protein
MGTLAAFLLGVSAGLTLVLLEISVGGRNAAVACSEEPCRPCNSAGHAHAVTSAREQLRLRIGASVAAHDRELFEMLYAASEFSPEQHPLAVAFVEVNAGFLPMLDNFLAYLDRLQPPMKNILFLALDPVAFADLQARGVRAIIDSDARSVTGNFSQGEQRFRAPGYNKIVLHKWFAANRALQLGFDVFVLDVDVILARNPMLYLVDAPMCDLFVSVEKTAKALGTGPDKFSAAHEAIWINTGVLFWRSTAASRLAVVSFLDPKSRLKGYDDQYEFNRFMMDRHNRSDQAAHGGYWVDTLPALQRSRECVTYGNLTVHILSPFLFGTWPQLFGAKFMNISYITPFTLHFNWLSGLSEKRGAMQSVGLWLGK